MHVVRALLETRAARDAGDPEVVQGRNASSARNGTGMNVVAHLWTPLTAEALAPLRAGDVVLLSGTIYTARDAAHRRLAEAIRAERELPLDLTRQVIYYVGPAPARPGDVIGPAGPTTAGRVDLLTPDLLARGLKGMIGKGKRSLAVRRAMQQH